jgi:cytochrome oxidase Cu insertion factor (SCO1/SenC/PrrC family)
MMHSRSARQVWPLWALGAIVVVTVAWWAAALWPLPATTPEWVVRARSACFGSTDSGLPNSGGWILLIGTPLSMVAALLVIAGGEARAALACLYRTRKGAWVVHGTAAMLVLLAGAAGLRVSSAYGWGGAPNDGMNVALPAAELRRMDAEPPPLRLVDQHGEVIELSSFTRRPVLLTFAYGKCGTVCPTIVHNVLAAREQLTDLDPVVLVVTLDPWRDPPSRLPHIAASWGIAREAHVLSGSVDEVEATLDAWKVERSRDRSTGEIAHPSLVYLLDPGGRIAFVTTGNAAQIVGAARRL